jgi:hypothetical protein
METVQMYYVEETTELLYDNEKLQRWDTLVNELNLIGQRGVYEKDKSPIPFQPMNVRLENIFRTLCPMVRKVDEFDVIPIPLEILEGVLLSKREGYFTKIEVWYDEKQKDPVVIGEVGVWKGDDVYGNYIKDENGKTKEFSSLEELKEVQKSIGAEGKWTKHETKARYLIGRWGDVAMTLEELAKMAYSRYVSEKRNEYEKVVIENKHKIELLKNEAESMFLS